MEHLLQKSKCSIFHNIFKYMIFQSSQNALLWGKGLIDHRWVIFIDKNAGKGIAWWQTEQKVRVYTNLNIDVLSFKIRAQFNAFLAYPLLNTGSIQEGLSRHDYWGVKTQHKQIKAFHASGIFCCLLMTFANGFDLDQDQQTEHQSWSGSKPFDTLIVFLKEF